MAAAFGLGFSGIIPAYVLVLRELFPVNEASWRIPFWFFCNIVGMAIGGWLAGYISDQVGAYGPAFMIGVALNLATSPSSPGSPSIGAEIHLCGSFQTRNARLVPAGDSTNYGGTVALRPFLSRPGPCHARAHK